MLVFCKSFMLLKKITGFTSQPESMLVMILQITDEMLRCDSTVLMVQFGSGPKPPDYGHKEMMFWL